MREAFIGAMQRREVQADIEGCAIEAFEPRAQRIPVDFHRLDQQHSVAAGIIQPGSDAHSKLAGLAEAARAAPAPQQAPTPAK
jgi:hypothetical protein